ncbi:hypothetical protein [Planktothrix sp.]
MLILNRDQYRPSEEEIEEMWDELDVVSVPFKDPAINVMLEELRKVHLNGGAEFAGFQLSPHLVLEWFGSRNLLNEINFFEQFVTLPPVMESLSALEIETPLTTSLDLTEDTSAFTLDGELAEILVLGGAYEKFKGTAKQAKTLGTKFCDALFQDRYDEIQMYITQEPWTEWFADVAWDVTWFGVDKRNYQIWLLCITDTDY